MRKAIAAVAAVALVFGIIPAPAFAAGGERAGAGESPALEQRSEEEIEAMVKSLLAAGDYIEGKAIVCSVASAASNGGISAQSVGSADSLLGEAEPLSAVTAGQYSEATGESVPAQTTPAGSLSTQSASAGESVSISLVERDDMSTEQLLRVLLADPRVLSAEPDYLMGFADAEAAGQSSQAGEPSRLAAAADGLSAQAAGETTFDMTGYQWFSSGVAASTPQYLPDATNPGLRVPGWNDAGKQNASGVVAIMDSGVDYTHPDLQGVMYHFSTEQQAALGCGEFGYAPSRQDKTDPMDYYQHGTHCAGIVAAEWNGFGVSGVANGTQICAVSLAESKDSKNYSYDGIVKGFDFLVRAAKSGVDIRAVNCSFGASPTNNASASMIQAAGEAGIVTCIAAGNDNKDLDAIYDDLSMKQQSPYALRVDASRAQDDRARFSCYGHYTTDVFSPGSGILSTIPIGVDEAWRYFPQADASPLYKETKFEGVLPRVYTDGKEGENEALNPLDVTRADDIGVDDDSASVKFSVEITSGVRNGLYIDVPVGSLADADVQDMSFALYEDSFDITVARTSIQLADGTYLGENSNAGSASEDNGSRTDNCLYGWLMGGLHVPEGSSFARITENGQTYVRLKFDALFNNPSMEDFTKKTVEMHLDQIAIGKRGNGAYLPYCYMNGTSMATPAVTGCAAVVSSGIQGVSAAERAAAAVRILKGAVHQTDGYSGLCKQGGQVDLGILEQTDKYAPVLESAEVLGGSVTVKGMYFGSEKGTLTIGGMPAQPSSWSATEIVAPWPDGAVSGLVPISVKSGVGKADRAFMLSAPADSSQGITLFERDLAVPNVRADGLSTTARPYALAANDGGILFAAAANVDDQMDETTGYLFRSDDAGASWSPLKLPQPMKKVSLAAGDGVVYALGATPAGSLQGEIEAWHLYSYDIAKNEFSHLRDYGTGSSDGEMPLAVSLAYAAGNLYAVDCRTDDSTDGDGKNPSRMRIRKFDGSYGLGDAVVLKHEYLDAGYFDAPKVSTAGSSIYICDLQSGSSAGEKSVYGLERADVAADGSIFEADLSAAFDGLGDGVAADDICMAACENGLYLVGKGLDGLLPSGANHSDTFFLKKGATAFAPYSKALSLAPVFTPMAVCSNGWLYAFGASKYEKTPLFGRATAINTDPVPDPAPTPDPAPVKGETVVAGSYAYTVLSSSTVSVKLSAAGKKSLVNAKVAPTVVLRGKAFKVTAVAAKGFASAKKLKSVALGSNVKTIGAKSFYNCKKLATFKATSKALSKIGSSAFGACKKLTKLTMAKTMKLTKSGVKKCLSGSSVKTVDVKNSKKAAYKKFFTEKNCGKKVTLK